MKKLINQKLLIVIINQEKRKKEEYENKEYLMTKMQAKMQNITDNKKKIEQVNNNTIIEIENREKRKDFHSLQSRIKNEDELLLKKEKNILKKKNQIENYNRIKNLFIDFKERIAQKVKSRQEMIQFRKSKMRTLSTLI